MERSSLGHAFGIPADFAGANDITINLAKEREPGIEIRSKVHRRRYTVIFDYYQFKFGPSRMGEKVWGLGLAELQRPV